MKTGLFSLVVTLAFVCVLTGCSSDDPDARGSVALKFTYGVDDAPPEWNVMRYTNAAGNPYEVTEVQWFISDLALIREDGGEWQFNASPNARYIDSNIAATDTWKLPGPLPAGRYSGIRFTFGLKGENNAPGKFSDPPESNMFWPFALGGDFGGYHYMKLNGFWMTPGGQRTPFNFHLGVGQEYDSEGNVTAYVQNWFEVFLPLFYEVRDQSTTTLELRMNIQNWFKDPVVYDHNAFGSMIMKNQEALHAIRLNGGNVFSIHFPTAP